MSQQLQQLEAELQKATDLGERTELTAKIAIVLARLSRFGEAKARTDLLRRSNSGSVIVRQHVWLMLAEAIIDWYSDLSAQALDRVTRVQLLAGAMRYAEVHAAASAWKAHIQFETSDFDGMFRSLELSLQGMNESISDAQVRTAIVLSNAFWLCNERAQALAWTKKGRSAALALRDSTSLEAFQYNRSVLELTCLRADACTSQSLQDRVKACRSEMQSTKNLHGLTKNDALVNHLYLADARLLMLEGRYDEAITQLTDAKGRSPFAGYHFSQAAIDLEIAYCHVSAGNVLRGLELFQSVDLQAIAEIDIDDQLVANHLCHQMALVDSRFGFATTYAAQVELLARGYAASRESLALGLRSFHI